MWDAPEMAKLALSPDWSAGHPESVGEGRARASQSPPPISCSLGSCGRERLWGLFLVGLSPGRRDVQKSTGQAEGLAKVRVKRQAEE